jgi:hypothetical protein
MVMGAVGRLDVCCSDTTEPVRLTGVSSQSFTEQNTRTLQKMSAAWGEATLYRDRHSNRGERNGG